MKQEIRLNGKQSSRVRASAKRRARGRAFNVPGPTLSVSETWPRTSGSCQSDEQRVFLWVELAKGIWNPTCPFHTVPASLGGCPVLNIIGLSKPHGGCDILLYELARMCSRLCPLSSDTSFFLFSVAVNFRAQVQKDDGKMGPGLVK